jgi:hypothetical protein
MPKDLRIACEHPPGLHRAHPRTHPSNGEGDGRHKRRSPHVAKATAGIKGGPLTPCFFFRVPRPGDGAGRYSSIVQRSPSRCLPIFRLFSRGMGVARILGMPQRQARPDRTRLPDRSGRPPACDRHGRPVRGDGPFHAPSGSPRATGQPGPLDHRLATHAGSDFAGRLLPIFRPCIRRTVWPPRRPVGRPATDGLPRGSCTGGPRAGSA